MSEPKIDKENAQRITRNILAEAERRRGEQKKEHNLQVKYEGEKRRSEMLGRFIEVIQGV